MVPEYDNGRYFIMTPRSLYAKSPKHSVWDSPVNDDGMRIEFNTYEQAQAYVRENDLETKQPAYIIVKMVGW